MKIHTLLLTTLIGTALVVSPLLGCSNDSTEASNDEEKENNDGNEDKEGKVKKTTPPDENPVVEINSQLEQMTEIMKKHENDPDEGVKALRSHLQDNLPNMMFALGSIIAEADKIDNPKERQKYLTLITTQLALGFAQFGKYAEKYSEAIEGNEDASRFIREWGENWAATAGTDLEGIEQMISGF